MSSTVEAPMSPLKIVANVTQDIKKTMINDEGGFKNEADEIKSSITELFPWLSEFRKMCKCIHTDKSMASLMELMKFYTRNVSICVNECYTKPLRAAKLKGSIGETLLLFLYIYRELPEGQDRRNYLNNMSDLLAMYIDMELKASKKSKEDHGKICARLTSCLYVYLEHSTEHLLDTLIKTQFMCRSYHCILDPIITKIIKSIPMHPESNVMYVRYLLIYRLWRKINDDVAVKNQITSSGITSLGPPPSVFPPCLEDVLPKVPKYQPSSAKFLLQHKFDIRKSCDLFIRFCRDSGKSASEGKNGITECLPSSSGSKPDSEKLADNVLHKNIESKDNSINLVTSSDKISENVPLSNNLRVVNTTDQCNSKPLDTISSNVASKSVSAKKSLSKKKLKKTNEIIVIDLTTDVAFEKCIKKKKLKKLAWLEEVKKQIDKKPVRTSPKIKKKPVKPDEASRLACQPEDSLNRTSTESTVENRHLEDDSCIKTSDNIVSTNTTTARVENIQVSTSTKVERSTGSNVIRYGPKEKKVGKSEDDRLENRPTIDRSSENTSLETQTDNSKDQSANSGSINKTEINQENNSSNQKDTIVRNHSDIRRLNDASRYYRRKVIAESKLCTNDTKLSTKSRDSLDEENATADSKRVENNANFDAAEYPSEIQSELEIADCVEVQDSSKEVQPVQTPVDEINVSFERGISIREAKELKGDECVRIIDGRNNVEVVNRSLSRMDIRDDIHETSATHNSCKSSNEVYVNAENKYVVRASELQENIDGLSLLASVSQHIPHLKAEARSGFTSLNSNLNSREHNPETDAKCEQIKVRDYASLKNAAYRQAIDEETDTNDSSDTISRLCENPTTEVINRIVGIYPENAIDKVGLRLEVTNELESGLSVETAESYDADAISNGLVSVENNVQSVKENTNVILNGETVVLLQKSPNSNLYIINKAVENAREHNDDEAYKFKEKNWISIAEDCTSFEVINAADHIPFNLDLVQYNKEMCQDSKFIARSKGIKQEPPEEETAMNLSDTKNLSYTKKTTLSNDVVQQGYQDPNSGIVIQISGEPVDKRKSSSSSSLSLSLSTSSSTSTTSSISSSSVSSSTMSSSSSSSSTTKQNHSYKQNIKQEFNGISNHITATSCGIQGCTLMHSHPQDVVESQHPTTLPSIYASCPTTELCVPYRKHCTSVSCSLQINTGSSLRSHAKPSGSCGGRSHCSCLNCAYDVVAAAAAAAHCRQCLHPTADTRVSCIETNTYFQTTSVREDEHEDQLLRKIEQSLLQSKPLEKIDVKREPEKLRFEKEVDNKLPLKKRLKAHAMMSMSYEEMPIKSEKVDSYPGIPMMSIAALESLDASQKHSAQIVKPAFELTTDTKGDHLTQAGYRFNSSLARHDYYEGLYVATARHDPAKENSRKHERQQNSGNSPGNLVYRETFESSVQRKDVTASNPGMTQTKRYAAESIEQEALYKKPKKTQLPIRQTRSSKRNVPKVNYCYTDVDPEWNPSGESKRKRKKTSR